MTMKHKISSTTKDDHLSVASCADEGCNGLVHSNERPDGTVVYSCNTCSKRHEKIPLDVKDGKVAYVYGLPGMRRKQYG